MVASFGPKYMPYTTWTIWVMQCPDMPTKGTLRWIPAILHATVDKCHAGFLVSTVFLEPPTHPFASALAVMTLGLQSKGPAYVCIYIHTCIVFFLGPESSSSGTPLRPKCCYIATWTLCLHFQSRKSRPFSIALPPVFPNV